MKKQLIALALSTALLAGSSAAIAPEEAFPAVNTYPGFADVAGSAGTPPLSRPAMRWAS